MTSAMQVTFWGVRGSIPSPGALTARYGGNTACVAIDLGAEKTLVLDAGTGIRALGKPW
jgi:phosphoribosyl 1,2-cyclic phosphodiesterase